MRGGGTTELTYSVVLLHRGSDLRNLTISNATVGKKYLFVGELSSSADARTKTFTVTGGTIVNNDSNFYMSLLVEATSTTITINSSFNMWWQVTVLEINEK